MFLLLLYLLLMGSLCPRFRSTKAEGGTVNLPSHPPPDIFPLLLQLLLQELWIFECMISFPHTAEIKSCVQSMNRRLIIIEPYLWRETIPRRFSSFTRWSVLSPPSCLDVRPAPFSWVEPNVALWMPSRKDWACAPMENPSTTAACIQMFESDTNWFPSDGCTRTQKLAEL